MPPPWRVVNPDREDVKTRRRRRYSSGDREKWSRKVEYFFACLGYAVGLGNIWRFPYLCYRNGGGAFLIPYILALCVMAIPILFMEMSFGQFASLGPITIWRAVPLFKGIGYAIVVVLSLVNTYYNVLIAYSLFYLFASITSELPWSRCGHDYNTKYCLVTHKGQDMVNSSVFNSSSGNDSYYTMVSTTAAPEAVRSLLKTPTEEFFENYLLRRSSGIHEFGYIQLPLIVCLAVSWFVCFMCLFKGIKSMGKAVIVTTVFSYVILTVLLIRGATLPGAAKGIIYYLKPNFSKLGQLQVWGEACSQAFASLSLGAGGWITLSSYSKFNNKCHRDAVIIGIGNCLTSIYSGFVIFSVLGFMSYRKGVEMDIVTDKGPGLAFIAYPEGLAMIPGAPIWSICFFFMMFSVGLDSLFGQVETIVSGIVDEFPDTLRPRRKLFTLGLCVFLFVCGIPLLGQNGIYVVTLMDWYTLLFSLTIISLMEVIAIMYVYGYKSFIEDIEMMLGTKPSMYYTITWLGATPVLLLCVIIFLSLKYIPPLYGNNYIFPQWSQGIGWAIAFAPITLIPITMIILFFIKLRNPVNLIRFIRERPYRSEVIKCLIKPTSDWGPGLPEIRRRFSYDDKRHASDTVFPPEAAELVEVKAIDAEKNNKKEVQFNHDTEEIPDEVAASGPLEGETERKNGPVA